jgi:hypothetical protein
LVTGRTVLSAVVISSKVTLLAKAVSLLVTRASKVLKPVPVTMSLVKVTLPSLPIYKTLPILPLFSPTPGCTTL